jgi:ankyrin repeat protein
VTELLEALYSGQQERVAELLARKPELNVFESAAFGQDGRLEELLRQDPHLANAYGPDGFQPLGLACFFGQVGAARLLLAAGADPNTLARNEHIQTSALHAAAASEHKTPEERYELCELLLDRGADPNLPQPGGFRAIDAARQDGDERLEQLLVERGAER